MWKVSQNTAKGRCFEAPFALCEIVRNRPLPAGGTVRGERNMKQQYLEAGQIVNTHGIRGEVRIVPWADSAAFLRKFKTFYIDGKAFHVVRSSEHKRQLIVQFEEVTDINAAMPLKGKTVFIDRADAKLPRGRFFIQDILGADVVTDDGASIGKLTDVLDLPGGQVYEVKGPEGEHLIPAVPEFVKNVDVDGGVITVHLIEGM